MAEDGSIKDKAGAMEHSMDDPLALVDRTDIPYEERLAILQGWKADLARIGAPAERLLEIDGAIQALEMGAATQGDEPEDLPEDGGYGVPPKA